MSRYLSANSYGSGSRQGDRNRSRSPGDDRFRTRPPTSSRREETRRSVRSNMLPQVRVLDQSGDDPFDTPPFAAESPTFRFAVFVMHFAISLLESDSGRAALYETAHTIWDNWGRARRTLIFRQDVNRDRGVLDRAVDRFLENIRADPPNILVSSRLQGEGLAQRQEWSEFREQFEVKWGTIFRLNKRIIDDAIAAADAHDKTEFRRFLFLMGMSTAHELVHAFVGVLTGDTTTLTPPPADFPRPGDRSSTTPGESGRFFEGALTGFLVEAYQLNHGLGDRQAGELLCQARSSAGNVYYILNESWMLDRLYLDFRRDSFPAPLSSWQSIRVRRTDQPMQMVRRPPRGEDFGHRVVTSWIQWVNSLPTVTVDAEQLSDIMHMVTEPRNIRPLPSDSGARRARA
ncbi:hypothetical protein QBC42DRAFT_284808 [Cladorrhinum samala]|uniref:Uncharacterized protein n=1 Tax=Cladorrhinum samala TaxID=585594 RepID=A0AAV9HT54_9PEZI|nr:hypothetical protein QBC42DRAFT_284808 [Cladorrhinum samala]